MAEISQGDIQNQLYQQALDRLRGALPAEPNPQPQITAPASTPNFLPQPEAPPPAAPAPGGLGGLGGFVSSLYSDLLKRQGNPDELSYWANSGQDPSKILDNFLASQEYRQKTALPMLYRNDLGRDPDQSGLDYYLGSKMSLDDINAALLGSQESKDYFSRLPGDYVAPPADVPLPPRKPDWLAPFDFGGAKTPLDMITKWYQQFGGTYAPGAAGGNFAVESYLNPFQKQMSDKGTPYLDKDGNPKGYGYGQLGGYRLNGPDPGNGSMGLNDFARAYGFDPETTDPMKATELQLRHQLYEMQDGWLRNQNILDRLKNAQSLSDAVGIFGGPTGYERPKVPVVPGTKNFTERLRDAEIIHQYMNGGLNSLSPDQSKSLMDWMSRSSPMPQVNPNIDVQQFGPNLNMSGLDPQSQSLTDALTAHNDRVNGLANGLTPLATDGFLANATMPSLNYLGGTEYGFLPIVPGGIYSSGISPSTVPGSGIQTANPFGSQVGGVDGGNGSLYSDNMFLTIPGPGSFGP